MNLFHIGCRVKVTQSFALWEVGKTGIIVAVCHQPIMATVNKGLCWVIAMDQPGEPMSVFETSLEFVCEPTKEELLTHRASAVRDLGKLQ